MNLQTIQHQKISYRKFKSIVTSGLSALVLLCSLSCNPVAKNSKRLYEVKMVNGSTNNKIEVLDFGGEGESILFLAGLGNSAHVYADFAPKFSDKFHVYAMTRRGFGASEYTGNGYHIDTLTNDILAVTKGLNLNKVILVGHSLAGDEMTLFASRYPEKVAKLVYLDAAHDRVEMMKQFALLPKVDQPSPTKEDSASLANMRTFLSKKLLGVSVPEEELKAISEFDKSGKYLKDASPIETTIGIIYSLKPPSYQKITCPSMAIYAIPIAPQNLYPYYDMLDVVNKVNADSSFKIQQSWAKQQMLLFSKEVKNASVKEIQNGNHYLFLSHPVETEKYIREFLN